MTKAEVDDYFARINAPAVCDSTYLGEDTTHEGTLTITLDVFRQENVTFTAYARADWDAVVTGLSTTPASGKDYIALTWGGDGALVQESKSITGSYYTGKTISFSRAQSDSYGGYCWQFNEVYNPVLLVPDWMEYASATVKLSRTSSTLQGKETAMRITYIHTYQSTTGTISFEPGNSSSPLSVELSSTPQSWQIEVDVPGLNY